MRWVGWWVSCALWLLGVAIYLAGRPPAPYVARPLPAPNEDPQSRCGAAVADGSGGQAGPVEPQPQGYPPWRRTTKGWERAHWLAGPSPSIAQVKPRQPGLHPLVLAGAEIAAILLGAWLLEAKQIHPSTGHF